MADVQQEKPETETKIKGPVSGYSQSGNKQTADRMANKQRKKESAQTQSKAVARERVRDRPWFIRVQPGPGRRGARRPTARSLDGLPFDRKKVPGEVCYTGVMLPVAARQAHLS
jgi:hypothetical protein